MTDRFDRFVILTHDHPFQHWDLMLEERGVLRTWRLHAEPIPETMIVAEPLPDHRLAYLDYEGPVSGDRGHVLRWDQGEYRYAKVSSERIDCRIVGQRLTGTIVLSSMNALKQWQFCYYPQQ